MQGNVLMNNCEKCNEPLMVDGNCFRREPGYTSVTLQTDKQEETMVTTWNPIESAPKDGTVVDLWIAAKDCNFRAPDFKFYNEQWVSATNDDLLDFHYGNVGMFPTHWMHRPGVPEHVSQIKKDPSVRFRNGQIIMTQDGIEHIVTTNEALNLAANLNSAVFLKGDY